MSNPDSNHNSDAKTLPNEGMLGTRNPESKELSRAEFLRAARALQFSEKELAALRALYGNTIENTTKLDNFEPSIHY